MTMHFQKSDPVILGSGELYILEYDKITDPANLTENEEEQLINIGAIERGCTITVGTETKDIKSGNRGVVAKWIVDKEVKLTTGVMTWIMKNVAQYLLGANYEETKDGEKVTQSKMVISKNDNAKPVYLRFVHNKRTGGQLIVNIYRAIFDSDLQFTFDDDNPTSINYEFLALSDGVNNNYVEFIETFEEDEEEIGG
ncbi:MAG: hypothetical protein M0Q14_01270 [Tissierellaceae bacterium]|nr:hypothetical protein [Tissierellaceae bacterium]